jgi:hypothetical protein
MINRGRLMGVKEEQENQNRDTDKIWCPYRENFQYAKVCDVNCKKKDKCESFRHYLEPKLF